MTLSSFIYIKKQDGGWIKIYEIFSGKSLKEDLSIDTTFDPCYFLWDSTYKWSIRPCIAYLNEEELNWQTFEIFQKKVTVLCNLSL